MADIIKKIRSNVDYKHESEFFYIYTLNHYIFISYHYIFIHITRLMRNVLRLDYILLSIWTSSDI